MGIWNFQSILNRGELDPLTVGRIDLADYYNGVETGRGVLAMPQGGMKKRPGQEYLGTVLTGPIFLEGRLENFSFSVDLSYLLVFTDLKMQIYKNDVLQTNINGSGLDYLVTPWTIAQVKEMDYIQSADTGVLTHEDIEPKRIVRTSDTAWTITALPLTNIPQYDFNDGISPTPISEIQVITFASYTDGDRFKISLNGILTEEIVFAGSAPLGRDSCAESIQEALLSLPNTGNTGVAVAAGAAGVFTVTLSGDSADDWDEIIVTPISSVNTAFAAIVSTTQAGLSRKENVWSAARGWPRTCTFHEGRLWFGGSKSLPQTIWGSFVNDFFNFKSRNGLDDESISATLDTDQINTIQGIFSNRSLQIFTSGGEFYVKSSPITPENIAVTPQTKYGSKRVRPVTIDGVTLFVQRAGKSLMQFVYLDEFQANQTTSLSTLAPHLIKNPIKLAISQGSSSSDANYVYILNTDGSLTVFNTLSAQGVAGFTDWGGQFISSIAVVNDKLYVLVFRGIEPAPITFQLDLEVANESLDTDGSVVKSSGTAFSTITGLDHLEGYSVHVKADGYFEGIKVVSGGEITLDYPANNAEAGQMFFPEIKLMPLNVNLQSGPNSASKKIMRASIQIHESNGIIVNGQRLPDKTIGVNQFDAPTPYSGIRRIFLSGWSTKAQITITQDTPMPMTILNVGMEVKV